MNNKSFPERGLLFLLGLLLALPASATVLPLSVRGHDVTQSVFSLFARPGETLRLGLPSAEAGDVRVYLDDRPAGEVAGSDWQLTAPVHSGLYQVRMEQPGTGARTRLNLFVGSYLQGTDPFLEGYLIGSPPFGHSKYPARW